MLSGAEGERFIQKLCTESFFADYVFPNPTYLRGTKSKELCDALILFRDTAVLIEVKTASELREAGAPYEKVCKWVAKKKRRSIKQLGGAIRAIQTGLLSRVENPRRGIVDLSPTEITSFYGVIVLDHPFRGSIGPDLSADGAPSNIVINCNFREFGLLCEELSTLGDFLRYLEFRRAIAGRVEFDRSGELDLLAGFKTRYDLCEVAVSEQSAPICVVSGQWDQYAQSPWRRELHVANKKSYIIDAIVQDLHRSFAVVPGESAAEAEHANRPTDYLRLLDVIARLSRCERLEIGKRIFEKSGLHMKTDRPRFFSWWSRPHPLMVFLVTDDREERREWLGNLVRAAQIKVGADEAIGVALDSPRSPTASSDWCYSAVPWKALLEQDIEGDLQNLAARAFRDAEHETIDEWDATSAGRVRARARRRPQKSARPRPNKQRRKKSR